MADIGNLTAIELAQKVVSRQLRPTEIIEAYFQKVVQIEPQIDAYLLLLKERALSQAKMIEEKQAKGMPLGRLAGVPVAVKDNIMIEGYPATCASKILEDCRAVYTATVVKRLEEEGAIIIGKTNLDEFAMGSSTENSGFKTTKNPWDISRVPGGSSGGSAAAVAAGLAAAALGSDTGGSIRQPAAFCGVVGFKPTYGFVSRFGLVAFASSLDQIGPMTRTVSDAALLFEVISGHDPMDSTSLSQERMTNEGKTLRIGLPKEYFSAEGADPEVLAAVESAVKIFQKEGARIVDVSLPHTRFALPAYYIIAPSEASANLARFDGIRYGKRRQRGTEAEGQSEESGLITLYKASRTNGFGAEVQRRILIGTFALSHGYYEAYYGRAQEARRKIADDFDEAFRQADFIATPTTPTPAFKIGEKSGDPVAMYLSDIFTIPVNLAGIPAVSIPCGFSKTNLPVGLQILGPRTGDKSVLELAEHFEKMTANEFVKRPAVRVRQGGIGW
ncbi:MAG: Asp-tRNA(Asn)/Glu-tRNA(Gln) amidotransferase subunit GatA [Elusimicrobia bacterium]|nr:Asp-tRNA(Asn)/Glu-tRNA(Gln) amidotransferase subunit GatA [Elusimicrobiota bacterium]